MPIQFPDFQRISFDEANPWLVGAERGQKFAQNAFQFPVDLQQKMLANQIAQVQAKYAEPLTQADLQKAQLFNQWYGKDMASQIGLRGAQATNLGAETDKTRYLLQHPGFMGGDETKSLEALRQMGLVNSQYQQPGMGQQPQQPQQQQGGFTPIPGNQQAQQYAQAQDIAQAVVRQQQNMGIPQSQNAPPPMTMPNYGQPGGGQPQPGFDVNGLVRALINKPMTDLQYKQTLTQVMAQNLAGKAYTSMPSVEKEYAIAQARALGYTGEQASRMFNQGYDLSNMAQAKGFDGSDPSSWPIARGAPTTAIQTRIQRANSTMAALNAVEPVISAAYANYSPRFNGVAPGLIKDMMTGENPDQQAEAFAAYALYPEIQALRINAQGGNVGEGAIQHMADASFSRLSTLGLSPNSLVYQKAMKRVNQLIRQMNKAENSAIYGQRQQSYEDDDRASASNNSDLSGMSDADLQRIAGGG